MLLLSSADFFPKLTFSKNSFSVKTVGRSKFCLTGPMNYAINLSYRPYTSLLASW